MFIVNIVDGQSRESALDLFECYDITHEIRRLNNKLRYIVYPPDWGHSPPICFANKKYRECEAAFQMNWYQSGASRCEMCNKFKKDDDVCGHLQFTYPIK